MGSAIEILLDQIDAQRNAILSDVAALSPDGQRWRAEAATWTALEVLEHLVLAERVVLGDLQTAAGRPEYVISGAHRIRAAIVWLVLRFGVRVRVPAEEMLPKGQHSFPELRTTWEAQHHALRKLVTRLDTRALQRMIFRHPIAGPLNTWQALRLLIAHLGTHQRQLQRIRAALLRANSHAGS